MDRALDRALADKERWVLQSLTPPQVQAFAVGGADAHMSEELFHTVYGFCPTSYGVSALGRASQARLVNIARLDGLFSLRIEGAR